MNSARIKNIRKACSITDKIFSLVIKSLKNNSLKTEKQIDGFIRNQIRKRKLKIAFPPIVASGKRSSEIHPKPTKYNIKKGFLVLDFGVRFKGYCSDMTRTIYKGKPSKKEQDIYKKLLSIQKSALKKAKPGIECFEIDYFVRKRLKKFRECFLHSLGHGVGKKIHQAPNLSPKTSEILKKGDIITIEPGIYIKDKYGLRIEDTVLVQNNPEQLTKSTKKLITIR
ncbi:M24 family metallopeptidase [Candidatus Woesearchaeota archaeon]|nr:M24 family metallopeptidase [Candidatus Woesearchaeota archaeon]